jgi:cytochrome P450 family 135
MPSPIRDSIDMPAAADAVFPPGPRQHPVVQTLRWFYRPIAFMEEARRRYGEVFSVKFVGFQTPLVFFSDPEAVRAVYSERDNGLPPGRNLVLEPLLGTRSVLLLEGDEHLSRRKLMLPPFHGERLRAYESVMEEVVQREIDRWPTGVEFPIHPRMQAITLEVILRAVFGVTDGARLDRLRELLRRLLHMTAAPSLQLLGLATRPLGERGPYGRFERLRREVDAELFAEIAERRADPHLEEREDILAALASARFEDGEPMGDEELRDQLMTLLLAGHETTATALAWTFDLLLRNSDALARLRAEIEEGESDAYLRATITESLRLRPVVPIAGRRLAHDLEVDGMSLAAGTDLSPLIWLTHTRPDLYPDPYAFRPERFLESAPETYGWIPFGGGIRRCLGAAFAEFELRVVLRDVIGRCELRAADPAPERVGRRNVTFSPKNGTRVVVTQRSDSSRSKISGR